MLAAFLYGPGDIRLREARVPEIGDNEVLVRVKSTAICGTDIRMINNGCKGVDESNPRILGHEIGGIIEGVGSNVKIYKEGMRVAIAPNMGCGLCRWCVSGNTHLCNDYRALGINMDGGFAEYVKVPEAAVAQGNIAVLDDNVEFDEAALNEPLSCVYNGFSKYKVNMGDVVLIIGAGPIGLMHAMLCKMAGASEIIINDLSKERLNVCKKVDKSFITVDSSNLEEYVHEITKGKGVDVCVTACPSPKAQAVSLKLAAINGRINFFGGLPAGKDDVAINTNLIHYKQLTITGSTRASVSQYRKTMEFISQGLIDVKSLISSRFSLDRIKDAVGLANQARGLKNIIYFE